MDLHDKELSPNEISYGCRVETPTGVVALLVFISSIFHVRIERKDNKISHAKVEVKVFYVLYYMSPPHIIYKPIISDTM